MSIQGDFYQFLFHQILHTKFHLMVADPSVRYYSRTIISKNCRFCEILHQIHNILWLHIKQYIRSQRWSVNTLHYKEDIYCFKKICIFMSKFSFFMVILDSISRAVSELPTMITLEWRETRPPLWTRRQMTSGGAMPMGGWSHKLYQGGEIFT